MRDQYGREITLDEARAIKARDAGLARVSLSRAALIARRIEAWRHPHTGMPLRDPLGETCGSCANAQRHASYSGAKTWIKCAFTPGGHAATDIRARWPACQDWRKADG
jgi:hypothetical protein